MAAPKKKSTPKVTIGTAVQYVGSKGLPKLAFVTGTSETVVEGHSLPTLAEGQLHLTVWEFGNGHFVSKLNIPFEGTIEEGQSTSFWRLA